MPEIGSMQQTELLLINGADVLSGSDNRFDQLRRIPLCRLDGIPFTNQPVFEKLSLCRFAGTVGSFKGDQEATVFSLPLNFFTQTLGVLRRVFGHSIFSWRNFGAHYTSK